MSRSAAARWHRLPALGAHLRRLGCTDRCCARAASSLWGGDGCAWGPRARIRFQPFVRLEVEPKAAYEGRDAEARFYAGFFNRVVGWVPGTPDLVEAALAHARAFGLSALDALHVAAALAAQCDELVTSEAPTKPILRVDMIPIVSIHPT